MFRVPEDRRISVPVTGRTNRFRMSQSPSDVQSEHNINIAIVVNLSLFHPDGFGLSRGTPFRAIVNPFYVEFTFCYFPVS